MNLESALDLFLHLRMTHKLRGLLSITLATSLLFTLGACSNTLTSKSSASSKVTATTPLSEMNEGFLYLAAQDAIRQGQQELAIQFLDALVKRNPEALMPRMQLAELFIRSNRAKQAITHINTIIADAKPSSVKSEDEAQPHILLARALAISGKPDEALEILSTLLLHQPQLLEARLLHVSLLANMNRLDEAHHSINTGYQHGETPELRKVEADLLIRQNRLDDAVRVLKAMQKLNMDNETPTLLLSQIEQQRNNLGKAEQLLREYIEQRPSAIRVRNALGRLLVQSGRANEAITIYKGLVRDTGGTAEALSTLGLLYYQNGDYEHAAEQFRKALASTPEDNSRFYLAASLEAMGRQAEAQRLYREIDKKSAAYVDAQLRLAGLDLAADQIIDAEKRTRSILADHPDTSNAYMLLSSIYLVQKKYQLLLDETETALTLSRIPTRLLFNRAIAYEHFKQYENVERSLRVLLSINPNHSEALNFLGYVFAEQGIHLVEAKGLIERALKEKPNDGYYLDSLSWVYFKQGDFKKAAKLQRSAIEQIGDDPVLFEHLGDILWRADNKDEARKSWEKALELKHEKPKLIKKKIIDGLSNP